MKRVWACCAAFSFALLACGDDSSSNSSDTQGKQPASERSNKVELTLGKCLDHGLGVLYKKVDSEELDKAYLVEDSTGATQILVPELGDYCGIIAQFVSKRQGDTLSVWTEPLKGIDEDGREFTLSGETSCSCIKDHWFTINADDADAKYFKYSGEVFEITSDPAPERPEIDEPTIPDAPEFSESEPHQEVTDVIGHCDAMLDENDSLLSNKFLYVDAWNDFSERDSNGVGAPFARTHYDGDDVVLVFEETFNCDEKVEKVNVYPSNDTLYAKPEMTKLDSVKLEPGEGCACMTRAAFKLKNEGVYAEAKYMVFGNHMEYVYTLKPGTEK